MIHIAQTNLQLYAQLHQARWPEGDLRQIHAAYQFAIAVFAGHFRPSQKPFLAHLVGVASILAECQSDVTIVTAGLLHSVYSHAEFGDGLRGITDLKRRAVRKAVGVECEQIIESYGTRKWGLKDLASLIASRTPLAPLDEAVSIIKLSDVLEDHLDDGMRYSPRKGLPENQDKMADWRAAAMALAIRLGRSPLIDGLHEAFVSDENARVPSFLHTLYPGSFVLAPKSHRARASMLLGRLCHRIRVKLDRLSTVSRNRAA